MPRGGRRRQHVGVTSRAELDHRDARGRVRGEHVQQSIARTASGAGELLELRGDVLSCTVFSRCPVRTWEILGLHAERLPAGGCPHDPPVPCRGPYPRGAPPPPARPALLLASPPPP